MERIIIFFALLTVCLCKSVTFTTCKGHTTSAEVAAVTIEPCEEEPCSLIRGQNASIGIQFTSGTGTIKTLTNHVYGDIKGIRVPFPISYPDACKKEGLTCPIEPKTACSFSYTLPVSKLYPAIPVVVEWEMTDQDKKDVLCVKMQVQLK